MALAARGRGNEGQARVCARRAAGVAVREYFLRLGIPIVNPGAYDLLQKLVSFDDIPIRARQAAECLTVRVTGEFQLPVDADLLEEARILAENLLPIDLG